METKVEIKLIQRKDRILLHEFNDIYQEDIIFNFDGLLEFPPMTWAVLEDGVIKSVIGVESDGQDTDILICAYTAPESRGKGYFTMLVSQIIEGAKLLGKNLRVYAMEKTSYPLFKKLGFKNPYSQGRLITLEYNIN